jgi:hypothetical protein
MNKKIIISLLILFFLIVIVSIYFLLKRSPIKPVLSLLNNKIQTEFKVDPITIVPFNGFSIWFNYNGIDRRAILFGNFNGKSTSGFNIECFVDHVVTTKIIRLYNNNANDYKFTKCEIESDKWINIFFKFENKENINVISVYKNGIFIQSIPTAPTFVINNFNDYSIGIDNRINSSVLIFPGGITKIKLFNNTMIDDKFIMKNYQEDLINERY